MISTTQVPYYVWFMSRNFQTCLSWAPLAIPPKVCLGHYSCKLSNLVLYLKKNHFPNGSCLFYRYFWFLHIKNG